MQAETIVNSPMTNSSMTNSPMTNLPMTNLPNDQFAELPTCRFAELPKLLEGEHLCEPKNFPPTCRLAEFPICRPAELPICRIAENFGSAGASPSSKQKFSVVQKHDPPASQIFW